MGTEGPADPAAINSDERVLDVGAQLLRRGGETLTSWTRLADYATFVQASALGMLFPDYSFDVVWTQHATMNIPDRPRLYSEIAHQPLHFPVP